MVELWDKIILLPLIGMLDSERTQVVMENLLSQIVKCRADIAIVDISGVPIVDTLVAQHLIKTVSAARLMGADCIISGIRSSCTSGCNSMLSPRQPWRTPSPSRYSARGTPLAALQRSLQASPVRLKTKGRQV